MTKFHMPARGHHVGRYPFTTCSVTGPIPTLSPSFLLAQAIFEPHLFFPVNTPTFLKHISAYEDGTDRVFRNVGI